MINHIERLKQHISKASFSHGADRHSALQCVAEIEEQLAAIDALDRPDPWTLIKDGLPTSGVPVLLSCSDGEVIRAIYAAKHALSTADFGLVDDGDTVDYSEQDDEYHIPDGWYEFNHHERGHWHIQSEAKCWMPLPLPSFNKNL